MSALSPSLSRLAARLAPLLNELERITDDNPAVDNDSLLEFLCETGEIPAMRVLNPRDV